MSNNCTTCHYFLIGMNDRMGVCRRYPQYQNRHTNEWCGEHMGRVHKDLPDTIENLVKEAELKEAEAKRKPGRPKLSGRQIP